MATTHNSRNRTRPNVIKGFSLITLAPGRNLKTMRKTVRVHQAKEPWSAVSEELTAAIATYRKQTHTH